MFAWSILSSLRSFDISFSRSITNLVVLVQIIRLIYVTYCNIDKIALFKFSELNRITLNRLDEELCLWEKFSFPSHHIYYFSAEWLSLKIRKIPGIIIAQRYLTK